MKIGICDDSAYDLKRNWEAISAILEKRKISVNVSEFCIAESVSRYF